MKKYIYLSAIVGSCLSTVAVSAADNQQQVSKFTPFVNAKVGYNFVLSDGHNVNGNILGLTGGFEFADHWSVDLGYQSHSKLTLDESSPNLDISLFESALSYRWQFDPKIGTYARIGAAYLDVVKGTRASVGGVSPLIELGGIYKLSPTMRFNLSYQYLPDMGDDDYTVTSHSLMLGFTYTFDQRTLAANKQRKVAEEKAALTCFSLYGGAQDDDPQAPIAIDCDTGEPLAPALIQKKPADNSVAVFPRTQYSYILFGVNSNYVDEVNNPQLKDVLRILETHPEAKVEIIGHSDSSGGEGFNQTLSEDRARAVAEVFARKGISYSRLNVQASGEHKSTKSNDSLEGRAKNRRVELIILPFEYKKK